MAVFKENGEITMRGELVSTYIKGDEVQILKEEEGLLQVVVLNGKSEGKVAYINPDLIEIL